MNSAETRMITPAAIAVTIEFMPWILTPHTF